MTPSEAAERLDGGEYGREGSKELFAEMKAAGLVAVFGASDDLMEMRGAVYEEAGACGGGEIGFTSAGLLETEHDQHDCPHCPYFEKLQKTATPVRAIWDRDGFSWIYETAIPHETFVINEDGEPYCRGIVFALTDVPAAPSITGDLIAALKLLVADVQDYPAWERPCHALEVAEAAIAKAEAA